MIKNSNIIGGIVIGYDVRGNSIYSNESVSYFDTEEGYVRIDPKATHTDLYYFMLKRGYEIKTNTDLWREYHQ